MLEGELGNSDDVLTLTEEEDLLKSPVTPQDKNIKAKRHHKNQEDKKKHKTGREVFQEKGKASFPAKRKHSRDRAKQLDDALLDFIPIKVDSIPQSEAWDEEEKNRSEEETRMIKRRSALL